MPPVILLALVGAAGLAGYRLLQNISAEARSATERQKATSARRTGPSTLRDLGNLEWDEAAGVYRPNRKG
jgi:hypothetical protein